MTEAARPVRREALEGPADEVAPRLLGLLLVGRGLVTRVVEVEAYEQDDPASHTAPGPTARNATMYGPAGHLYVHRSHGIHLCANVVTGPRGHGAAVLLRAVAVLTGAEVAAARRGGRGHDDARLLAGGPGRLGQVLDLVPEDDGLDLRGTGPLRLLDANLAVGQVVSGPRVGVRLAADRPWRFWFDGHPAVSAYRRHPGAD